MGAACAQRARALQLLALTKETDRAEHARLAELEDRQLRAQERSRATLLAWQGALQALEAAQAEAERLAVAKQEAEEAAAEARCRWAEATRESEERRESEKESRGRQREQERVLALGSKRRNSMVFPSVLKGPGGILGFLDVFLRGLRSG